MPAQRHNQDLIAKYKRVVNALHEESPTMGIVPAITRELAKTLAGIKHCSEEELKKKINRTQEEFVKALKLLDPQRASEKFWNEAEAFLEEVCGSNEKLSEAYQKIKDGNETEDKKRKALRDFWLKKETLAACAECLFKGGQKYRKGNASQERTEEFFNHIGDMVSELAEIGANQNKYSPDGKVIHMIIELIFGLFRRLASVANGHEEELLYTKDEVKAKSQLPNPNKFRPEPWSL